MYIPSFMTGHVVSVIFMSATGSLKTQRKLTDIILKNRTKFMSCEEAYLVKAMTVSSAAAALYIQHPFSCSV
jgi:hypothetical protein